ncbi:hypothetical protein EXIGLDRAFT_736162 [Exidia glandulosa HHB12029]|uniref:Uncharacterized protein n=1 Tax=Exidia glandulosa HHB12029 TaxID=1314781 RepID=A0A165JJA5_EXIGL|nr:hypothetical protein EXIGLDRAFT_736162 [Exidia glandulosa HHB12029]
MPLAVDTLSMLNHRVPNGDFVAPLDPDSTSDYSTSGCTPYSSSPSPAPPAEVPSRFADPAHPLVAECPSYYDRPFANSTFVVIAIDPMASVVDLDNQARMEAAQMRPIKYLALMDHDVGEEMIRGAYIRKLTAGFHLTGVGRPDLSEHLAAIPVAPSWAHSLAAPRRGYVTPSYPLPWPNCHIAGLDYLTASVSRIHHHHTAGPCVSHEQRNAVRELSRAYQSLYGPSEDDVLDVEFVEQVAGLRKEVWGSDSDWDESEGDDDRDLGIWSVIPPDDAPRMRLNVEIWVDVHSIERPGNPADLRSEMRRLMQIELDWAQRVMARCLGTGPDTSLWLEGIYTADTPDPDSDSEANRDGDDHDVDEDSIYPEDAIEHRAARLAELDESEDAVFISSQGAGGCVPSESTESSLSASSSASSSTTDPRLPATLHPRSITAFFGSLRMFAGTLPYALGLRVFWRPWLWRPFV